MRQRFVNSSSRRVNFFLVWAALASCLVFHAPSPTEAANRTLLMADDHHILTRPGAEHVLHSPRRHELNPLIKTTKPWEQAIGYCSVHRNEQTGKYQLWYQAYSPKAKEATHRVVVAYAESDDGLRWVKPNLGLYSYDGQSNTNITLIGNGGRSTNYGAAVLYDPRDSDAGRRYKMAYWDFPTPDAVAAGGNPAPGLFVAFSEDGLQWRKHLDLALLQADYGDLGQPPLASDSGDANFTRPAISDVIDLMYDPPRETFVIYAKTWIDGPDGRQFWKRAVVRTESQDFIHWSRPELVMAPDAREAGQLHGAPVFFRHGMYFGLVQTLDFGGFDSGGTGDMPSELAASRDGRRWTRPFRQTPFISVRGDGSSFDAGCLWTNAMPIDHGDEIRFYYSAYPSWNADIENGGTGIGLAVMQRDRLIGLRPIAEIAQVTLKPMSLADVRKITVNAAGGAVRVELLNVSGERMPGFSMQDSIAIEGDSLEGEVRWQKAAMDDLQPGLYQIRIHLDDAELFAITLDSQRDSHGVNR